MSELGSEERAELLERMRERIERWGPEPYVAAKVVEPNDRFFPDPYTRDLRGLRTIARRLMGYAGLGDVEVDVFGEPRAGVDPLAETLVVVADAQPHEVTLAVYSQGPASDVPLVLAHEVARIYRLLRSGPARAEHPYRAPPMDDDEAEPDPELEEEVSLTAGYLGFGLLAAMGAHQYRAEGELHGYTAITRYVHRSVGALLPDEACFLLAVQAIVRDVDEATIARWRAALSVNQERDFVRFLEELRPEADALVEQLGLPPRSEWPAPDEAPIVALEDDGWEPAPVDAPEPGRINEGVPVFRRRRDRGWDTAVAVGAASFAGFLAAVFAEEPTLVTGLLIGGPLSAVAAYFLGKGVARTSICSHCEVTLKRETETCPGCGGTFRGEIGQSESHLDALEKLKDVTAFGGAIVEAQDDADPRYVKLGVKCPHCGWIPDGEPHWSCPECHAPGLFNTFAHGGECPKCDAPIDDTACPRCDHVSAYDWWWPDE